MNVLDLFSGIGGFSLGLERAGMRTVAFCEIDPFCRRVLARHWPETPCYDDVRNLTAERLVADGVAVDVVCGGFPCQDISKAGPRTGLAGKRSGLWFEFARIIGEVRPKFVIIENVTALRHRGLDVILRFFASIRYDAEWHCVPAGALGAPDIRDRIWVIAYPQHPDADGAGSYPADLHQQGGSELCDRQERVAGPILQALPRRREGVGSGACRDWHPEPGIRRVVDRTSEGVDRTRVIGNAVKPIIPEIIGRALMAAAK
jgi:DNA (cytosine-5)-methyltransferase 1